MHKILCARASIMKFKFKREEKLKGKELVEEFVKLSSTRRSRAL